jgi:hypothetical protein
VDPGAVDALVGAGAGAAIAFVLGRIGVRLGDGRSTRRAARLVRWELFENRAIAADIGEHGSVGAPSELKQSNWIARQSALADLELRRLDDVQHAYSTIGSLDHLLRLHESDPAAATADWTQVTDGVVAACDEALAALAPYCVPRWPWGQSGGKRLVGG